MHKALQTNAPFPYPHLVILFLHNFNVPLHDEPFVKFKCSFAIGASAVTSFGYRKDMDGQWVRKQDLPRPIPNERTSSPPLQQNASSSLLTEVLTELHDLRAFVGDRFDVMDSRITRLEDDMSFIRRWKINICFCFINVKIFIISLSFAFVIFTMNMYFF